MTPQRKERPATHKQWQCPKCEWVYTSPISVISVQCWGGDDVGRHPGREMKPLEAA